jgi:ubiquitin-protein ligase
MPLKHIVKEFRELENDDPRFFIEGPDGDEWFRWLGKIYGPEGSPYEGGTFNLEIELPADYPFKPPRVRFTTPIFHCNVFGSPTFPSPGCPSLTAKTGIVTLHLLGGARCQWSPVLTVKKTLMAISSLLADPDPYPQLKNLGFMEPGLLRKRTAILQENPEANTSHLDDPNFGPANPRPSICYDVDTDIAGLLLTDKERHDDMAKECVRMYARLANPTPPSLNPSLREIPRPLPPPLVPEVRVGGLNTANVSTTGASASAAAGQVNMTGASASLNSLNVSTMGASASATAGQVSMTGASASLNAANIDTVGASASAAAGQVHISGASTGLNTGNVSTTGASASAVSGQVDISGASASLNAANIDTVGASASAAAGQVHVSGATASLNAGNVSTTVL